MSVWDQLKYPVTLQIMDTDGIFIGPDGEWETVFIAENAEDLEFRLSAYHMPTFFERLCMVDAAGMILEQSHENVADFIVRDFWVLEERTRATVYQKRRERQGKGKARKGVVHKDYTFIPRFQYDLSVYQTPKTVQHQARVTFSPHLVSGHIRRLPSGHQASLEATQNAQEFGIQFGDGETFVRPHERGEIEPLRNYRSRSTMQLLFEESEA